jgi:hypothetical protein
VVVLLYQEGGDEMKRRFAVTVLGKENLNAPLGFDNVWIDAWTEGEAKRIMLDEVSATLFRPIDSLVASADFVKYL